MKSFLVALMSLATVVPHLSAAEPKEIKLFPAGAEEMGGFKVEPEQEIKKEPDDGIRRVGHVSEPTITLYKPDSAKDTGTTVLVMPGGGYSILALEHEGTKVCEWLNSIGVTAALLKYRVPRREPDMPYWYPLQDAREAMRLLRRKADEWGIKSDRIGVLGFSAGGNLAAMLSLNMTGEALPDNVRPNFMVLIYPAYLTPDKTAQTLVPELVVDEKAPPVIMVHANNDPITPVGSALLYLAYKQKERPAELHIYEGGGHGFGMKANNDPINNWTDRVGDWLKYGKWLTAP